MFMKAVEDQLRKVKFQYMETMRAKKSSPEVAEDLLGTAKLWFLRTLENTDLEYEGITLSAVNYIQDESLAKERTSPYNFQYPSIIWILSILDKEQLETIFGRAYYTKVIQAASSINSNYSVQNLTTKTGRW